MPYDPYPALPYLKGYLKRNGIVAEQYDVNNAFYNYILTPCSLKKALAWAEKRFLMLQSKEKLIDMEVIEYRQLLKPVLFGETVIESINESIKTLHDSKKFYDPGKYHWATTVISAGLALYSCRYFPEKVTLSGYSFPDTETKSIGDILDLIENGPSSIFEEHLSEVILAYIEKHRPPIIGFSMFDYSQFYSSLLLVKLLKKVKAYSPKIIFGGILMSFYKEKLVNYPQMFDWIDVAVVYEGEQPLLEYMAYMAGERALDEVRNIIYRTKDGCVQQNAVCRFDINEIAVPDYEGIAMDRYFSPERIVSVMSSKGCPWAKCTFCTQHLISGRGVYVERDLDKFIWDIKRLKKVYKTKFFWFNDTSVAPERLTLIADRLIEESLEIVWRCETRFEKGLTNDIIMKLSEAGCKKIGFGMESGSDRILKAIKKGIVIDEVERILECCYANGIAAQVYYIIGFPDETLEDIAQTIEFVRQNKRYMGSFGFSQLYLEEGSDMQLFPKENGVRNLILHDELRRAYKFESDGISSQEASGIVKKLIRHYAKEIGEKPFWGDEVESHHLFYLDYYNMPCLENARINKTKVDPSAIKRVWTSAEVKQIEYDFNQLYDDVPVYREKTDIILDKKNFKIYKCTPLVIKILDICKNKVLVSELIKELAQIEPIAEHTIHQVLQQLIIINALEVTYA
jgi:radical SAM superfamily enzyme YgiQ (UPF0313 family)